MVSSCLRVIAKILTKKKNNQQQQDFLDVSKPSFNVSHGMVIIVINKTKNNCFVK